MNPVERTAEKKSILLSFQEFTKNDNSEITIEIVEHYGQTKENYLAKYPKVVNLLNKGISQRQTAKRTGESENTVKKVNIINKYCGQTPNPYLEKYSDVVRELKSNKTQREVADITGVSVPVVNIVAQVAQIDYVRLFKDKAKKKAEKKAIKERRALQTRNYINRISNDYSSILPTIGTKGDLSPKVLQIKKYVKKLKIAEGHTKKDWIAGVSGIFKALDKIVESRLREIDRRNAKKLAKENLYISPETKLKQERGRIEFHIGLLNKYLDAGINPFNEEWNADKCPVPFEDLQFEGTGIDSLWIEDQKEMEKIRKVLPDKYEYAENRLQLFNVHLANRLLKHHEKLSSPDTSTWEVYRKEQEARKQAQIKEDMRRNDMIEFIYVYGMEEAF